MADLTATSPMNLPADITIGTVRLSEVAVSSITSVAPFKGQVEAASHAMLDAHGVAYPAANQVERNGEAAALWFGHDSALLIGPDADASLSPVAALVDQSDAWCIAQIEGAQARDVLARLTPADMRASAFGIGQTMRTQIKHMTGSITRVESERYHVMVFRSMAQTLIHDVTQAMARVAARSV